jgi:double-stranded uracil-DNA glycosylase
MKLPDLFTPNLNLVFCGTAASNISAEKAAYYAHPQNAFWPTLAKVGLTPHQLKPEEFKDLLLYGIGLTDLAKAAQGMDKNLKKEDYDKEKFKEKILLFQPAILAFTSKKAGSVYFKKNSSLFAYGAQTETIGSTQLWVLPSPSGAARSAWDESIWQALADAIASLP